MINILQQQNRLHVWKTVKYRRNEEKRMIKTDNIFFEISFN